MTSTSPRRVAIATVVGVVAIAVATLLPALALYNASPDERQKWSDVGQAIGGLGSLFAGLAFIGLIATLLLQNRQIVVQNGQVQIALADQKRTNEARSDRCTCS